MLMIMMMMMTMTMMMMNVWSEIGQCLPYRGDVGGPRKTKYESINISLAGRMNMSEKEKRDTDIKN